MNESYISFWEVVKDVVERYVPERVVGAVPGWVKDPPRSMMRVRARTWRQYKSLRCSLGRHDPAVVEALSEYNALNREYRNFSRNCQLAYELDLSRQLGSATKLFHNYVRLRKRGRPPVGPLRLPSGIVISDRLGICEAFADSFSGVFVGTFPVDPAPHAVCSAMMLPLSLSYDRVLAQLLAIRTSSAPGPQLFKSATAWKRKRFKYTRFQCIFI